MYKTYTFLPDKGILFVN